MPHGEVGKRPPTTIKKRRKTMFANVLFSRATRAVFFISAVTLNVLSLHVIEARAGGGPENVVVVVNPKSADSVAVANFYVDLRKIPGGNVIYIPWDPKVGKTSIDEFRKQILFPVFQAIHARGLANQIDLIAYSCDFPWAISLQEDYDRMKPSEITQLMKAFKKAAPNEKIEPGKMPINLLPTGSLTGMTYLYEPVFERSAAKYIEFMCNYSVRASETPGTGELRSFAFHATDSFTDKGVIIHADDAKPSEDKDKKDAAEGTTSEVKPGRKFMPSVALGVTYGRGNTVEEICKYLKSAKEADGSAPKGTYYFMKNMNIRSKARDTFYLKVQPELEKLGLKTIIRQGTVPLRCDDVAGLMTGTEGFDWEASKSKILPGAICDNLTSYGGIFEQPYAQTPISEFLRYGAAGATGAVEEPTASLVKFPLPYSYIHYVSGCNLAESLYLSILSPYQLIIVGEPLCQPWALSPVVTAIGVDSTQPIKGEIKIQPSASYEAAKAKKAEKEESEDEEKATDDKSDKKASAKEWTEKEKELEAKKYAVARYELFVNGVRVTTCKPDEELTLDTRKLPDGYHELRVVAVSAHPTETQGQAIIPITTNNFDRKIEVKADTSEPITPEAPLKINASSPGSKMIVALQNSRIVGQIKGEEGDMTISSETLGDGVSTLTLIGIGEKGALTHVIAAPIKAEVKNPPHPKSSEPDPSSKPKSKKSKGKDKTSTSDSEKKTKDASAKSDAEKSTKTDAKTEAKK